MTTRDLSRLFGVDSHSDGTTFFLILMLSLCEQKFWNKPEGRKEDRFPSTWVLDLRFRPKRHSNKQSTNQKSDKGFIFILIVKTFEVLLRAFNTHVTCQTHSSCRGAYDPFRSYWYAPKFPLDVSSTDFLVKYLSVPEYNVVHPVQVDEVGAFVSHELSHPRIRLRRSSDKEDEVDSEEVHYKLSAFGNNLHLHLKRNRRLLTPSFKVEVIGKNGKIMKRHAMENCHYVGRLKAKSRSTVAISNCNGLVSTSYHH